MMLDQYSKGFLRTISMNCCVYASWVKDLFRVFCLGARGRRFRGPVSPGTRSLERNLEKDHGKRLWSLVWLGALGARLLERKLQRIKEGLGQLGARLLKSCKKRNVCRAE